MKKVYRRLEGWRSRRTGRSKIPAAIWAAAGQLAREHGVSRVAEVLGLERTRAGLAQARLNGKQLGRPITAGLHAAEVRKLHRAGVAKAEIARRLQIGRASVRRILG
jgi:DNA invertase Pin-like site-specific DNA recombinase